MRNIFGLILLSVWLGGCGPFELDDNSSSFTPWEYSDLRQLDPVDADIPEHDLIAIYTKATGGSIKIRLDILDLVSPQGLDIFILIDTQPGGASNITTIQGDIPTRMAWDYLILIPASGKVEFLDSNYSHLSDRELLISRDPYLDTISISFNKIGLPPISNFSKFQVLIKLKDNASIVDQSSIFYLSAPPPSIIKTSFIFWNVFPSETPAQTLRSWAGAHSGPMRGRHGLKYLLNAAEFTNTPILLLDLFNCDNLSSLDYLNELPYINSMIEKRLINAPVNNIKNNNYYLNGEVLEWILVNSNTCENYNMKFGSYGYAHYTDKTAFSSIDLDHTNYSATETLTTYKEMMVTQGTASSTEPIVFGGDFSLSWFGDPTFATQMFTFIQNQPWIQVTDPSTTTMVIQPHQPMFHGHYNNSDDLSDNIYKDIIGLLKSAPSNEISNIAWQVLSDMYRFDRNMDSKLGALYANQLGHLVTASIWYEHPRNISGCSQDIDFDLENECVLSNENLFLTVEPHGGYIPFIFYSDGNDIHQIVGPTWEFALGLSDPSEWNLSKGVFSDPDQILGALHFYRDEYNNYKAGIEANNVVLVNDEMSIRIIIQLGDKTVTANILTTDPITYTYTFPLVIDPWKRFNPSWGDKYTLSQDTQGISWRYDGFSVELKSNQHISIHPFNESKITMSLPEDPNFDYPRGHYLPFPVALAEIIHKGNTSIELIIDR